MSAAQPRVRFEVDLSEEQAEAFATFLKRAGHDDYARRATSSAEAYRMLHAGEAVRECLAEAGYAPR